MVARSNIAIVSIGRSGSTLLMKALGSLPDTVYFFEPYFTFETYDREIETLSVEDIRLPRLSQLFDCSIFDNAFVASAMMSHFACNESRWIAETPDEVNQCMNDFLESNMTRSKSRCMNAKRNVVKTLRLPWLSSKLGASGIIPNNTRVISLIRHPRSVLKSQYAAGWDYFTNLQLDVPSRLALLASKICQDMIANSRLLHIYSENALNMRNTPVLVVQYEWFVEDFTSTMRKVMQFIEADDIKDAEVTFNAVREIKHAAIPTYDWKTLTDEEADQYVSADPACQSVLERYYHQHNEL